MLQPLSPSGGSRYTALDLFCGAGGISLGLSNAGFKVVGAADINSAAARSYKANFEHPFARLDLSTCSLNDLRSAFGDAVDNLTVITGGPPCQGFSIQRIGPDFDRRNDLVLDFARLVSELKPVTFVMENVTGLLGSRGASVARTFVETLVAAGYTVQHVTVNMAAYGVPQMRRRVLFYGWLEGLALKWTFPYETHDKNTYRTVWDAIGDLGPPAKNVKSALSDPLHYEMNISTLNRERLRHIPQGAGFESLPVSLRVDCHRNGSGKIGHRHVYGRLAADAAAGTITARFDSFTRGKFAHPFEDRNITLREGARLQTFPDSHLLVGTQEDVASLIGNAVPPHFSQLLFRSLRDALHSERGRKEGIETSQSLTPSFTNRQQQLRPAASDG